MPYGRPPLPPPMPHGGYYPPPRKTNAGVITLVALGCAIVLGGIIVLIGVNIKDSGSSSAEAGYDDQPTAPPTTAPPTTDTPAPTTDAEPTTETTPTETGPQPVDALAENPLHGDDIGVFNEPCDLPAWQSTPAASEEFFLAAEDCMIEAWSGVMEQADLPFEPPSMQFPSGDVWDSPCGGTVSADQAMAFYCSINHTIYMPFEGLDTDSFGDAYGFYLSIFGHEYGHAVQSLSGILDRYHEDRYDAGGDSTEGKELTRRSELQANCFAGMFFGATTSEHGHGGDIDQSMVDEAYEYEAGGDSDTHGSSDNRQGWFWQGYTENRTLQCNTWAVDASAVS